jgi:lipoprotein signal peptidase
MKIKRIASLPFAMLADVVTLGNMGDRSFTQQVFDAERREQRNKEYQEAFESLVEVLKSLK